MLIAVTGGRDYTNRTAISEELTAYGYGDNILILGGANGADELARRHWHYKVQLPYIVVPAKWNRYGNSAGPIRNGEMMEGGYLLPSVRLQPDILLAFPGGSGTKNAIAIAERAGIPVRRLDDAPS